MSLYPNNIPRCQYIKTNGTQCGSPALKRNHFCYFHKRWRDTRVTLNANRARRNRAALDMPVLEDAESIQVSLMQVMRLILSQQIDPKTAGLLLYALQTASSNVRRLRLEPVIKTRIVIDPSTVGETGLDEDLWRPEDFVQHIQAQASPSLESSTEDLQEEACVQGTIANLDGRARTPRELTGKREETVSEIQKMTMAAIRRWLANT